MVSEGTKENIYVSTISDMSDTAYDHNDRLCHDSQQKRNIEPQQCGPFDMDGHNYIHNLYRIRFGSVRSISFGSLPV